MVFPYLETALRLIVPLIIFRFTKFGIFLSVLVDIYDWKFVKVTNAQELAYYQTWDKSLDFYYQVIILIAIFKFKDALFKKTAVILFFFRLIGLIFFNITHNRQFLFFFPNVFENFVIFYLLTIAVTKESILFRSKKMLLTVLILLSIPKLIHEYFMHFLIKQPWEIYNAGKFLGLSGFFEEYVNYLVFGSAFYIMPIGLMIAAFRKWNKKQNHKIS